MTIFSAVLAFFTFGATAIAAAIWNIGQIGWAFVGAALATVAIGTDSDWLRIGLTVFGFAMTVYAFGPGFGDTNVSSLFSKLGLDVSGLSALERLFVIGVSGFITMATLTSVRDGVTFMKGVETSAGEIIDTIVDVGTGAIDSIANAVFGSPWLIAALGIGAIYLISSSGRSGDTNINLQPESSGGS